MAELFDGFITHVIVLGTDDLNDKDHHFFEKIFLMKVFRWDWKSVFIYEVENNWDKNVENCAVRD